MNEAGGASTPLAPPAPPATQWGAVWAVFAAGLVCGAYLTKAPPALPLQRAELGLTLVESGLIATVFNLLGGLGGMLAGILCDRYGHKRLGVLGLLIMAAGGFLGAAAPGYAALLASRFLEGAGFILFTVSGAALIAASAPVEADRARAFSLWSSYMPAGGSLALFAAPLVFAAAGWRGLWVALAFAAAAGALLVARAAPTARYGGVGTWRLVVESLRSPGGVTLALLFTFYVAQWSSVMVWLPTFLAGERGASAGTAALLTALMVLANVPGNLAGGWLLGHGVARATLVMVASVAGAACALGMFSTSLPDAMRFGLVLLFSGIVGVIPAATFSGVPVHARSALHIGTTNGMVMQSAQLGQFVAPILFAWLATRAGGWGATLGAMLVFAAGTAACGFAIGRIERSRMRP